MVDDQPGREGADGAAVVLGGLQVGVVLGGNAVSESSALVGAEGVASRAAGTAGGLGATLAPQAESGASCALTAQVPPR